VTNIRFTPDEVREVLGEHTPREGDGYEGELECSCSGKWLPRIHCYYCRAKLPKHKKDCTRPSPESGTTYRETVTWTENHFIQQLWKAAGIDAKEGD